MVSRVPFESRSELGAGPRSVRVHRRAVLQALAGAGVAWGMPGGVRSVRAQGALALTPLRAGLFLVMGAGGNVVLDTSGDGLVLVDSGSAEHADDLAGLIATHGGGAAVRMLLNTHWHLEHTGGNELVGRGATIAAHESTRLWMSTKLYVEWEDRHYEPRAAEALPNETFYSSDPQPLIIENGGSRIEYAHLPEAHTDGDIYVRFPEANVIVAGGTLTTGRYPILDYITGGWIGGLIDATRTLIDLSDADSLIVPDVGAPQRRADLEAQRTMLETVRERIEAIALEGRGVEDMIAAGITREFDERYGSNSELFISNAYESMWWSRLRGIVA